MSKQRLIQRLKWYYPTEKAHTYLTFPAIIIYAFYVNPLREVPFLIYGLLVCTVILYQGQRYWGVKLKRLQGEEVDQEKHLRFFRSSKKVNVLLTALMPVVCLIQMGLQSGDVSTSNALFWGFIANGFAILEHVNYYHIQLMVDNEYDLAYLRRNKRLKKASLAKDMAENNI